MNLSKKIAFSSLGLLALVCLSFFLLQNNRPHGDLLLISFLDIGQGDAIFIEAPNGKQVLVDSGPDRSVLRELGRVMPLFDRSIDVAVITNPDKDHIGGFIPVFERFEIQYLVEPGTVSHSDTYDAVENLSKKEPVEKVIARRDMRIVLDSERGVYLQILFPDTDVTTYSTNDGSIIMKLVYGDTSVLLQGDAPQSIEKYLLYLNKNELDSDILKVGHHGSRTSTLKEYVEVVTPEYAVISLGEGNSYGHPHVETLNTLKDLNIQTLRTDLEGRISFVSDGKKMVRID